jgi:hypothetical protein
MVLIDHNITLTSCGITKAITGITSYLHRQWTAPQNYVSSAKHEYLNILQEGVPLFVCLFFEHFHTTKHVSTKSGMMADILTGFISERQA